MQFMSSQVWSRLVAHERHRKAFGHRPAGRASAASSQPDGFRRRDLLSCRYRASPVAWAERLDAWIMDACFRMRLDGCVRAPAETTQKMIAREGKSLSLRPRTRRSGWLLTAGVLSGCGAAVHLGCVVGGPSWYRFFGAGERMARLAEQGSPEPAIVATIIAFIVGIWAAYALSGAGLLPRLPLLRPALVLISAIYLIRAAALPVMLVYLVPGRSAEFLIWSSAIVLVFVRTRLE